VRLDYLSSSSGRKTFSKIAINAAGNSLDVSNTFKLDGTCCNASLNDMALIEYKNAA
jgi:hypothetical protein